MPNLIFIFPEIFLSLASFCLLLFGVFLKNSYKIINTFTIITLIVVFFLILNLDFIEIKLFSNSFVFDPFSNVIKLITLGSAISVLILTQTYISDLNLKHFEYPIIILLSILGMFIMLSANDLIVFYLGLELQSLALYILASIDRDNARSNEAGLKYFILSALASGLLLYGCSIMYGFTGSTNFEIIAQNFDNENYGATFAMVFILIGLAFKVSAVPFHMWTPDVYEGSPTSVTTFFAIVPKLVGSAVLIRFMLVPFSNAIDQWQTILVFLAIASMILGSVAAIGQTNIKRLLAYSSIGHIGFVLAGIATGTLEGYKSTIVYLIIYLIMNVGAFACVLSMKKDKKYLENISDLSGISNKHPVLSFALLIIFFSLAGIPPLAGFFAKFYVFLAVIQNEMYFLAIIGLLSTVISAFYYLRVIKIIYFDQEKITFDQVNDFKIKFLLFTSCLVLVTFFLYPSILNQVTELFF